MNSPTFATLRGARNTRGSLFTLLVFATVLSACNGGTSSPLSATLPVTATSPVTATYTLSGAVSEMTAAGPEWVEGARVVDINSGRFVDTDPNGVYSLSGLSAVTHTISVGKGGYVNSATTVTMSGDTQLDVRLDRIAKYVLSGVIFEVTAVGDVPLEGVEVYCDSCGSPVGHTFVYTDVNGFYSLAWAADGPHPLFVRKAGYEIYDPTGKVRDGYGRVTPIVKGDTRFDVQLVPR